MCGSMVDIQSSTAEIRRGKKKERRKKKPQRKNMTSASAQQCGHNNYAFTSDLARCINICTVRVDLELDSNLTAADLDSVIIVRIFSVHYSTRQDGAVPSVPVTRRIAAAGGLPMPTLEHRQHV